MQNATYDDELGQFHPPSAGEMRNTAQFLCGVATGIGFYSVPIAMLVVFPLAGLVYVLSYKCPEE